MDKLTASPAEAIGDVPSGASLAVGGFGLCGIPSVLIGALADTDAHDLEVVSNNCGSDGWGLGLLLRQRRIRRVIASYIGENQEFARQYLAGEIEVELTPQGTLAERLRAGGCGIPAFYTATGVGTQVADGGLPWRYHPDGSVAVASPPKAAGTFSVAGAERTCILEHAIVTDFALVRAWKADRHGNLVFHRAARNFNPLVAMAGQITVAEVERLVDVGELDPDEIHLPGIFVQRVVALTPAQVADKPVEKRTTRGKRPLTGAGFGPGADG